MINSSVSEINSRCHANAGDRTGRRLTSDHHPAKQLRAAVPAVVSELVLALFDPLFGSFSDGLHQVGVSLTELPLLVYQAGDVARDDPGTQRPDVPAHTTELVNTLQTYGLTFT